MKILKFGSASIATAEKIKSVVQISLREKDCLVVLSSIKGTAESLAEISNYLYRKNPEGACEIITQLEKEYRSLNNSLFTDQETKAKADKTVHDLVNYIRSFTKDLFTLFEERVVMAQGEILSSKLFALLLQQSGIKVALIPALEYMRTDKNSVPDPIYIQEQLANILKDKTDADIYVTQGYICRNAYGEIDDLRKGGSDYTASLAGVALNASEIQIWADVDIMQNNDPRYVQGTTAIKQLNFDEAAELAYFGEKILHPTCIAPAKLANIPVRLMNTSQPDAQGTLISNDIESRVIKAVAAKDNITAIKIKSGRMLLAHGFLRRIFEVFEQYQTSIDMLTTSEVGISVTIDNTYKLQNIVDDLKKYGTVSIDENMSIISVVGDLDWKNIGFESQILDAVKDIAIRMISYGGSNYNISFLVAQSDKEKTLKQLNDKLFN